MSRIVDRCLIATAASLLTFVAVQSSGERPIDASTELAPAPFWLRAHAAAQDGAASTPPASTSQSAPTTASTSNASDPPARVFLESVRFGPLTEDEIDRCLLVAEAINPAQARDLKHLRRLDEEKFRRGLEGSPRLRSLARLMREDPIAYDRKLLELRNRKNVANLTKRLTTAIRDGAPEEQIATLTRQLRMDLMLQEAFTMLSRRAQLDAMRRQADDLEARINADLVTAEQRVDERLQEILDQAVPAVDETADPGTGSGASPAIANPGPAGG